MRKCYEVGGSLRGWKEDSLLRWERYKGVVKIYTAENCTFTGITVLKVQQPSPE